MYFAKAQISRTIATIKSNAKTIRASDLNGKNNRPKNKGITKQEYQDILANTLKNSLLKV
jgi:hypothetical protein